MTNFEAFILGLIQGLTEFLPVSSSGHLEIAKALFGITEPNTLIFTIVVHGATVLSIIVVFWKDILRLLKAPFTFEWNEDNKYIAKLLISAIPVGILGLFFKDQIESLFTGNLLLVGLMLWITTFLLFITTWAKDKDKKISYLDSLIIGIAQAFAVLPGVSRSGATIATGLLLGIKKEEVARFSFLMVLLPVIGANLLDLLEYDWANANGTVSVSALIIGFITAFITGLLACKFMLSIVKKSKLSYFAIYTFIVGAIAIGYSLFK